MSVEPCNRCRRTDPQRGPLHDVIDEIDATRLCTVCVIQLIGAAETSGVTLSLVVGRPTPALTA